MTAPALTPLLAANTQGIWERLPARSHRIAQAHAELAIAHPLARAHLHDRLLAPEGEGLEVELACLALGFEPEDARLIAKAWLRQAARHAHLTHKGQEEINATDWPDRLADFDPELEALLNGKSSQEATAPHASSPQRMGLYVVAPSAEWIARLVEMGVPTVQLRFKSDDPKAIEREVRLAIDHAKGSHSRLFIND